MLIELKKEIEDLIKAEEDALACREHNDLMGGGYGVFPYPKGYIHGMKKCLNRINHYIEEERLYEEALKTLPPREQTDHLVVPTHD